MKRANFNPIILICVYITCLYLGFFTPNDHSYGQGTTRGIVIGFPLVLAIIATYTVIYSPKDKGWKTVRKNLKDNFSKIFSLKK